METVFKEVKKRSESQKLSSQLVQGEFGSSRLINNTVGRSFGTRLAGATVDNPETAVRLATSDTSREMLRIAGRTAHVLKGLIDNFTSNQ